MSDGVENDAGTQDITRVLHLIDFLAEFNAIAHPPVRDINAYGLFTLPDEQLPATPGVTLTPGAETWLSVDFVELPSAPRIPASLAAYLPSADRLSPYTEPVPAPPARDLDPESGEPRRPELLDAARDWVITEWASWARRHHAAAATKALYRDLFEQSQILTDDRETFELLWGFGRLRWATSDGYVNHPLFCVPVEIERGEHQTLTVSPCGPLELDTLPLAGMPVQDRAGLGAKRRTIEEEPIDPWLERDLHETTRATVRLLDDQGILQGEGQAQPLAPSADTGWTLFLRRRRPDYQGYLDAMRALYTNGATPPAALHAVVIDTPSTLAVDDDTADGYDGSIIEEPTSVPQPLLLPLASNEEQQRILELAQRQSGVVVQGPPGTGKSHTIANLISHYVAYGQRVLVVAEKEQALRVLADKIPEQIRDLTVSVLGADRAGQAALESSINVIQSRVAGMDRGAQDRLIEQMTAELSSIDASIAATTDRLMATQRAESSELPGTWPCGPNPTPSRAAAWVAAQQVTLGFIPDRIPSSVSPPVTGAELAELARLVTHVGADRALECAFTLPDLAKLPTGSQLADVLRERAEAARSLTSLDGLVDWSRYDSATKADRDALRLACGELLEATRAVQEPWLINVAGKLTDPMLAGEWQQFTLVAGQERNVIVEQRAALAVAAVSVPEHADPKMTAALTEAQARLAAKGKLGMFAGDAKRALESCTIDGRVPATADEVGLCLLALKQASDRRRLTHRWNVQMALVEGPLASGAMPEENLGVPLALLHYLLGASAGWRAVCAQAAALGITLDGDGDLAAVEAAHGRVLASERRMHLRSLDDMIQSWRSTLATGRANPDASPHWALLAAALEEGRVVDWDTHREQVRDLIEIAPSAMRLVQLKDRLATAAPLWAEEILLDPAAAGEPAQLTQAWAWRVLDCWVSDIAAGESPQQLQTELERLALKRRGHVAELVGIRAWRRLTDNLGDRQRQALNSYLAAVRRFGKTGGKFKARWLEAIRVALNESKDAVPVWIMPTSRALTSFRPDERVPFDVLIVDEASQIDIAALPLLSLAHRAIVVGDDKQTSPSVVGMDQQQVFDLIDSHLMDIPHARTLFNAGNSLYDLAFQKFPRLVMLREHFRSLPEIISFSNRTYYDGRIEPLRDQRPHPMWQTLGAVKVIDGYRSTGGVNVPEANATVELLAGMVDDTAYDGMDFGVVCMLSGGQADLVKELLFSRLGPQVISERRIRVGDAANFQGDERDVMILSLVAATDPSNPTKRIGALTSVADGQRINVAASRARNQMWVVHSLDPERFPTGDPRAELIRHCRDPRSYDDTVTDQLARCDSDFERRVLSLIAARGYRRIRSQVHVGTDNHAYRIDLVVEGPSSRLAVECDGDAWHGPERWYADRARQQVLERAGWTFARIRGSAFYRNPAEALEPIWSRLDELGIPTGDEWIASGSATLTREVRGIPESDGDEEALTAEAFTT